jgi:hypothetical protein
MWTDDRTGLCCCGARVTVIEVSKEYLNKGLTSKKESLPSSTSTMR